LRITPGVIEGNLRPASLSEYLHHNEVWMQESLEIRILDVVIIGRIAISLIWIIEHLHAENGVNEKEKQKHREELKDYRKDLEQYAKDIFDLVQNL